MNTQEVWKAVVGYEGYYEVSNLGRVKRLNKLIKCRAGALRRIKEMILKFSYDGFGYKQSGLAREGVQITKRNHVIVLEAFIGLRPKDFEASHIDGDPKNNNLNNLVWESRSDNNKRKVGHGTQFYSYGELCGKSKLKTNDVLEIRKLYLTGLYLHRELAEIFKVSCPNITNIINRKTWKHI